MLKKVKTLPLCQSREDQKQPWIRSKNGQYLGFPTTILALKEINTFFTTKYNNSCTENSYFLLSTNAKWLNFYICQFITCLPSIMRGYERFSFERKPHDCCRSRVTSGMQVSAFFQDYLRINNCPIKPVNTVNNLIHKNLEINSIWWAIKPWLRNNFTLKVLLFSSDMFVAHWILGKIWVKMAEEIETVIEIQSMLYRKP